MAWWEIAHIIDRQCMDGDEGRLERYDWLHQPYIILAFLTADAAVTPPPPTGSES